MQILSDVMIQLSSILYASVRTVRLCILYIESVQITWLTIQLLQHNAVATYSTGITYPEPDRKYRYT